MELTQKHLHKYILYDPDSGIFYRKESKLLSKPVRELGYLGSSEYVNVRIFGKTYKAHRLAFFYMTGEWPLMIDHIDGDKTNNKWQNLRSVSAKENSNNQKIHRNEIMIVAGTDKFFY